MPDSPAVKRQKTAGGYNPTGTSTTNTFVYNSDADSGDELFKEYVPDTPSNSKYETQPTQIIDRSAYTPSRPLDNTEPTEVQVPASSPINGRDISNGYNLAESNSPTTTTHGVKGGSKPNIASLMAPAGTAYKAPNGIVAKPVTKTTITIDDDDEGPIYVGGSSDEDNSESVNIKPSVFAPRSAGSSFGGSPTSMNGNAKFQSIVANASYRGPQTSRSYSSVSTGNNAHSDAAMAKFHGVNSKGANASGFSSYNNNGKAQMRPERAMPVEDITLGSIHNQETRQKVMRLHKIFPQTTFLMARNALYLSNGNLQDAAARIGNSIASSLPISDDEIASPEPAKKAQPEMKRGLNAPMMSIKDRYSSTQAPVSVSTPPPKPKRKLMQGRRHPSSPAAPAASSPLKPQSPEPISINEYDDSDSGVASASEEDPELGARVLKYLNTCTAEDLVELTNITIANAEIMITARPFRNLDVARNVANPAPLKGGKKSSRAPIGDKIVDTAFDMFSGYEAIDALCAKCEELGKPLAAEMSNWGFDVFGAAKAGELEMTSFEDDAESQRDSGIGSPTSGTASPSLDHGDDDIKTNPSTRKKVTFLKKPDIMGDDCVLKDYQVVGLNWLALMYRHKLSGILADEMGLGKTCQVISLLSHLVENGHSGPHLVICPGSTLENWLREFPKFSPKLVVEPYYGMHTNPQSVSLRTDF